MSKKTVALSEATWRAIKELKRRLAARLGRKPSAEEAIAHALKGYRALSEVLGIEETLVDDAAAVLTFKDGRASASSYIYLTGVEEAAARPPSVDDELREELRHVDATLIIHAYRQQGHVTAEALLIVPATSTSPVEAAQLANAKATALHLALKYLGIKAERVRGQAEVAKTLEKAWRLVYVQVEPSDVERPVRADEQGLKHFIEALRSLLKAACLLYTSPSPRDRG